MSFGSFEKENISMKETVILIRTGTVKRPKRDKKETRSYAHMSSDRKNTTTSADDAAYSQRLSN